MTEFLPKLQHRKRAYDPLTIFYAIPRELDALRGEIMLGRTILYRLFAEVTRKEPPALHWFTDRIFKAEFNAICHIAWMEPEEVLRIAYKLYIDEAKLMDYRATRNKWRDEPEDYEYKKRGQSPFL